MKAYRTHLIVQDPGRVVVSNLPFRPGQYVEVLFLAQDDSRATAVEELEVLFRETQGLPHIKTLSESDVLEEIEAYRQGQ